MRDHVTRRSALLAPTLAAGALCGCSLGSGSTTAEQARAGDRRGYISGDSTVRRFGAGERGEPVTLAGDTLRDETWSVADHLGEVVVVNLWVSWCGPCHEEAADLVAAHDDLVRAGGGVSFIGVNFRESSPATGRAQAREWGLPYDSIFDPSGTSAVQMRGVLAGYPSTAVLDRRGRVASAVVGPITAGTLRGMVSDVVDESS